MAPAWRTLDWAAWSGELGGEGQECGEADEVWRVGSRGMTWSSGTLAPSGGGGSTAPGAAHCPHRRAGSAGPG